MCEIFEQYDKLDNLQAFVSDNAQNIYGICPEFKEVTLEKRTFVIPQNYSGVVPLYAGNALAWAIESVE